MEINYCDILHMKLKVQNLIAIQDHQVRIE